MNRASQPALPLQTMNKHCIAVRLALLDTQNPASLTPFDLDVYLAELDYLQRRLRALYTCFKGDESLRNRCETAGAALNRLNYGLKGRRAAVGGAQ